MLCRKSEYDPNSLFCMQLHYQLSLLPGRNNKTKRNTLLDQMNVVSKVRNLDWNGLQCFLWKVFLHIRWGKSYQIFVNLRIITSGVWRTFIDKSVVPEGRGLDLGLCRYVITAAYDVLGRLLNSTINQQRTYFSHFKKIPLREIKQAKLFALKSTIAQWGMEAVKYFSFWIKHIATISGNASIDSSGTAVFWGGTVTRRSPASFKIHQRRPP